MTESRHRGFTLVELIIFIVVVAVGIVGILAVVNRVVFSSADPMMRKQMVAIAESMLEEILVKDYADPDGNNTGETGRINWDNVADYNGYTSNGIFDAQGAAVTGLGQYTISVAAVPATAADSPQLAALPSVPFKITVTVSLTAPGGDVFRLTGYRSNY